MFIPINFGKINVLKKTVPVVRIGFWNELTIKDDISDNFERFFIHPPLDIKFKSNLKENLDHMGNHMACAGLKQTWNTQMQTHKASHFLIKQVCYFV